MDDQEQSTENSEQEIEEIQLWFLLMYEQQFYFKEK